jgi:hypothetical protein
MMNIEPTEALMRGLARAVARGRSVAAWARPRRISGQIARAWSELPDFRTLVDEHRISLSDRLVGKLTTFASRAIDRLAELSERCGNTAVSVSAARAIVKSWVEVSGHFDLLKKAESFGLRIIALEKRNAAAGRVNR